MRFSYYCAIAGGLYGVFCLKNTRKKHQQRLGNTKMSLMTIGIPALTGYLVPEFISSVINSGIVRVGICSFVVAVVIERMETKK